MRHGEPSVTTCQTGGDGLFCETDFIERVLDCRLHQAPMMEANAIV